MKKIGVINQPLATVIAGLGHLDMLVVADAGLPIPSETQRIDLAVTRGIPGFLKTVEVILDEMKVERAIIAEEMLDVSPDIYQSLLQLLADIPMETIPHTGFKEKTHTARAVIRTGEFTPYANVILISGVVF